MDHWNEAQKNIWNYLEDFQILVDIFSAKKEKVCFLEFNTHSSLQTEHHKLDNSLFGIWDPGCVLRSEGWGPVVCIELAGS